VDKVGKEYYGKGKIGNAFKSQQQIACLLFDVVRP
jgi:hypothetical protein